MNVRARVYQPAIIRWLSEDPIKFASKEINLARYVVNSPTNYTDPTGLQNWQRPPGGYPGEPTPPPTKVPNDQALLDWYRAIEAEMMKMGDDAPMRATCGQWQRLKPELQHLYNDYPDIGYFGVTVVDGHNNNVPFIPGFEIDKGVFRRTPYNAIGLMLHESMHDRYWGHSYIKNVALDCDDKPTNPSGRTDFDQFMYYLMTTHDINGNSYWDIILQRVGPRPPDYK